MSDNIIETIAVIGMAGRFPGAENISEFWDNIQNGVESITYFTKDELLKAGRSSDDVSAYNYVPAKGILQGADMFDAEHFSFSEREATLLDPQQRVMLETCYEALAHSSYHAETIQDNVGIFVSASFNTYLLNCLYGNKTVENIDNYQLTLANSNDFLATRIAYKLNLKGPAQTIQTACSSSLVSIHSAGQGLLNYECNLAIAGGVSITCPIKSGYSYKRGGIGSQDGHCRPFDKKASGTVPGNGVGAVILKRYSDAVQDGDTIYAVIKGSAVNNDGSDKVSFTAPSITGQSNVIQLAQAVAGVEPETIGMVETHGTGTLVGDPLEIEALKRSFSNRGQSHTPASCALVSSKANIGHLDAASGVVGFIKATLSLYHKKIPPSINYTELNPSISLEKSPFYINTTLKEWKKDPYPRRAGVSAFGVGGTNVHVVMEEVHASIRKENADFYPNVLRKLSRKSYWVEEANNETQPDNKLQSFELQIEALMLKCLEFLPSNTAALDWNKDFDDLGMDSFALTEFIVLVEVEMNVLISEIDVEKYRTISQLASYMKNESVLVKEDQSSFGCKLDIEIKSGDQECIPLFCIHPAGGSVAIFNELAGHFDSKQRVVGIRAMGQNTGEVVDNSVRAMAERYVDIVLKYDPDSYLLCGSSLGGLIAYEMAQILSEMGKNIGCVVMLDTPGPTVKFDIDSTPKTDQEIFNYIAGSSKEIEASLTRIKCNNPEKLKIFFNTWRVHSGLLSSYKPMPYNGDLIFFSATERSYHLPQAMESGWHALVKDKIAIYPLEGNHLTMHNGKSAFFIANVIMKKISSLPASFK